MKEKLNTSLNEVLKEMLAAKPELLEKASSALGAGADAKNVGAGTGRVSVRNSKRRIRQLFTRLHLREQLKKQTA